MNKGSLVVIEGSDGSGKGTQLAMLAQYCVQHQIPHATFDFPQYDKTFFGKYIGRFFNGEFGTLKDVSPYVITIPFAADRWQAKHEIDIALSEGKIVVANRYATSNAAYQAARLPNSKRSEFIKWNFELEYGQFGIPKEELVIYLSVPTEISWDLIARKSRRPHLAANKKRDLYEKEKRLLVEVGKVYELLAKQYSHWVTIPCVENGSLLSKEAIHQKVVAVLKAKGLIH